MLFENMLATLTPPELAAVLSVIIYERADGKDVMVRNRRLKEQLSFQEEGRGLSHAYILCGPAGSGRHTLARLLAVSWAVGTS